MPQLRHALSLGCLLAALAALPPAPAPAGEPPALPLASPVSTPPDPAVVARAAATVSPSLAPADRRAMHAELRARRDAESTTLAALETRVSAATDPAQALALRREIADTKHAAQLDVYRIQLRYAQAAGLDATVQLLQRAVAPQVRADVREDAVAARRAAAANRVAKDGGAR